MSEALLFAEHGENMLCTKIVLNVRNNFCTQHFLPRLELGIFMYWTCNSMNKSVVILWVSWCKNKSFWQRFTCTYLAVQIRLILSMVLWYRLFIIRTTHSCVNWPKSWNLDCSHFLQNNVLNLAFKLEVNRKNLVLFYVFEINLFEVSDPTNRFLKIASITL